MDEEPHRPFVVRETDEGCEVVDRCAGHVVAQVSERWLAELWASLLNDEAAARRNGEDDAASSQEDHPPA